MGTRIASLFLLLFTATAATAQTLDITLSPPVTVAGGSTYGSMRPRISLVNGNEPLVAWGKNAAPAYIARWNGSGFASPVAVTPPGVIVYAGSSEGPEVAGRGDTAYVVFSSLPTTAGKIYCVRSTDGGQTWSDSVRIHSQDSLTPYSPTVVIGKGGNPYVSYEAAYGTNLTSPHQYVVRSADGGQSFLPDVIGSSASIGEPCECCPPVLTLRDTTVYLLYRNNASNIRECYVATSTDNGLTFGTPTKVDFSNYNINSCPSSGPDMLLNGDSLTGVWMSKYGNTNRIYSGTMNALTGQFGYNRLADPSPPVSGFGQARPAIAGRNDTLAVVWDDGRNGNIDCWVSLSVSGVPGLQTRVQVNDTASDAGTQSNCDVAYDGTKFHFVYTDGVTNSIIYRTGTINGFVGINEQQQETGITLFPNPVADVLRVQASSDETLTITDAQGKIKTVMQTVKGQTHSLDVKTWPAGVYFYTNTNGRSGKFTVIH
jgi:hypothetical protein